MKSGNLIGIYEKALPPMPWDRYFSKVREAGFDFAEISLDESDRRLARLDWKQEQCDELRLCACHHGLSLVSACLSGHKRYPLGSADPLLRAKGMEILKKAVEFCDRTGVRILQVSGFYVYYEEAGPDTAKLYEENLLNSVRYAEQYGVMFAIEPVELHLTTPTMAKKLVDTANSPWLKIYPDAANMAGLGIDPIPEIENNLSDSVALHIREALPGFYGNVEFGTGILDFDGLFSMLKSHNYHGPITLEMWNENDPDYFPLIVRSREFIERKYADAGIYKK